MNKRKIGSEQEDRAAQFLEIEGYEILQRNYHCRFAEIDIVAKDSAGYLCFIEVKYRENGRYGAPEGVVGYGKQRRVCQGARFYMGENRLPPDVPVRFDVIFVIGNELQLVKNAFDYIS